MNLLIANGLKSAAVVALISLAACAKNPDTASLTAGNLTDENWTNGVWTQKFEPNRFSFFYAKSTLKQPISPGDTVTFKQSGTRKVISTFPYNTFINVKVDGAKLDPVADGYPNPITVQYSKK